MSTRPHPTKSRAVLLLQRSIPFTLVCKSLARLNLRSRLAAIRHRVFRFFKRCWPDVPSDRLHLTFGNRLYRHVNPTRWLFIVFVTWFLLALLPFAILQTSLVLLPSHATKLSFQADYQMLFILIVLSPIQCIVLLTLWARMETTFHHLIDDTLLIWTSSETAAVIKRFNKYFNSRLVNVFIILVSFIVGRWLIVSRSRHVDWWGAPGVSYCGFVVAVYLAWLIWYQLLQHNYKGIISVVLMWVIFRRGVQLSVFHEDRVYGLGGIAQLLLLAYTTTILHGLAVITLWQGQFLTEHDLGTIVFIGFFFAVFVPVFFALPSQLLMRQILIFKQELRERLRLAVGWPPSNSDLLPLLSADHFVDALPNHPFTRKMLVISGSGYVIQFISALVTIVQAAKSG